MTNEGDKIIDNNAMVLPSSVRGNGIGWLGFYSTQSLYYYRRYCHYTAYPLGNVIKCDVQWKLDCLIMSEEKGIIRLHT